MSELPHEKSDETLSQEQRVEVAASAILGAKVKEFRRHNVRVGFKVKRFVMVDGKPGPVEAAGVAVGSRLVTVNGVDVEEMPFKKILTLLKPDKTRVLVFQVPRQRKRQMSPRTRWFQQLHEKDKLVACVTLGKASAVRVRATPEEIWQAKMVQFIEVNKRAKTICVGCGKPPSPENPLAMTLDGPVPVCETCVEFLEPCDGAPHCPYFAAKDGVSLKLWSVFGGYHSAPGRRSACKFCALG